MATHRALVLASFSTPLSVETVPLPTAKAGQVIVRVLATPLLPHMPEVLKTSGPYSLSLPLTPGGSAIGRVEQVGPDAVSLVPGQLVFCDMTIRGRDDPSVAMLLGLHPGGHPAARKLMEGEWRNATFAEYAKFPLENVYALDEEVLLKSKGYSAADLCWLSACLVPFGGLSDIEVVAGDTVIVAPATGRFGGAAVTVALAMGASVIAAGRDTGALDALNSVFGGTGRLKTVKLTGNATADSSALIRACPQPRGADAYIDFSPPAAASSPHIAACIATVRPFGRCVLMGGIFSDISIPYGQVMFKGLRLQGKFMYDRAHVIQLIKMVEAGNLKLGKYAGVGNIGTYGLDTINEALEAAAAPPAWGSEAILVP